MMKNTLKILNDKFGPSADKVFIVGGAVRDFLLGKNPKDIDLLVQIEPEVLIDTFGAKFIDPKSAFPVFSMHIEGIGRVEVALPRTEKRTGPKHQDFEVVFSTSIPIKEDLRRRDFTINAMAIRVSDGKVFEPFVGRDLDKLTLRHVSDAFADDPLRVFRGLRFSSKGFVLAHDTVKLMNTIDTAELPVERVFMELSKAMLEVNPERFFENMLAMPVPCKPFFPEVFDMVGVVAGPEQYHGRKDVFGHSIDVMKKLKDFGVAGRLAGFFHDVGKTQTPKAELPKHHNHEDKSKEIVDGIMRRLKAPQSLRVAVVGAVANHMRIDKLSEMNNGKILKLAAMADAGKFADLLVALNEADKHGPKDVRELFKLAVTVARMSAKDVMDVSKLEGKDGATRKAMVFQFKVEKFAQLRKEMGV